MDSKKLLKRLGMRFRHWRIRANLTQEDMGNRIGASAPTVRKMENGEPGVAVHFWVKALVVLGRAKDIEDLLGEQKPLFDDLPTEVVTHRKRARRQAATLFTK